MNNAFLKIQRLAWRTLKIMRGWYFTLGCKDKHTGFKPRKTAYTIRKLGTEYGGWNIPMELINEKSICYSVGAGEDLSFDTELAEKFGCRVDIFDPTPRAIEHFKNLRESILKNKPFHINRTSEKYLIGRQNLERLIYHPYGIWKENNTQKFYSPKHDSWVSHSLTGRNSSDKYIEVPCKTLRSVMEELGHERIDILKLDIEGAEYEVLQSLAEDKIPVSVLCVEFDEIDSDDPKAYSAIKKSIANLQESGFEIIDIDGPNYLFINLPKMLIVDTYYEPYLEHYYKKNGHRLANKSYTERLKDIFSQCFGTADFYSSHLNKIGIETIEIIYNDSELQKKWAFENGFWRSWLFLRQKHLLNFVFREQIKEFRPDIIYCQNLKRLGNEFLEGIKKEFGSVVFGQIASPINFEKKSLSSYDLILTSFPHFVKRFHELGIKSRYFKIAFEPSILKSLKGENKKYELTFIGGYTKNHIEGNLLLEHIASLLPIKFWGYGFEDAPPAIKEKYQGEAWGLDMYNILHNSKITINRHINAAENYANNMRLYEATGVGTMLVTDVKDNLGDLFEVGKEVVAYSDPNDLVDKINYYLSHDGEREDIAKAGQNRTLSEHTYEKRMAELKEIIKEFLK